MKAECFLKTAHRSALIVLLGGLAISSVSAETWHFSAPPSAKWVKRVDRDWRPCDGMAVSVRSISGIPEASVTVSVFFQTKGGLWFESSRDLKLDGGSVLFDLRLDDTSPDWRCANGWRPFGKDVLRWVRCWGIQIFSAKPVTGRIEIGEMTLSSGKADEVTVTDVQLPGVAISGRRNDIRFRVHGFSGNPFDTAQVSGNLLWEEAGLKKKAPVYFCQEYVRVRDPGTREIGTKAYERPGWRVQWYPEHPGPYRLDLEMTVKGVSVSKCLGEVKAAERGQAFSPPENEAAAADLVGAYVQSNASSRVFTYRAGKWAYPPDGSTIEQAWAVPLDWTSRWGRYTGLGEFDQQVAWEFDRTLTSMPVSAAKPLVIFSDDELDDHGIINWIDHPYNKANKGHLDRPSGSFLDPKTRRTVIDRARYLWARYGHSPAVNGVFMQVDWPEEDVLYWVNSIAAELSSEFPEMTIFCNNLELPARSMGQSLQLGYSWRQDKRLAPLGDLYIDLSKKEVILKSSGTNTLALVSGRKQHWTGGKVFSCDVRADKPEDEFVSAVCSLRTAPDTVFQSRPLSLRADDWTRLNFYLDQEGAWSCSEDPSRKLGPYDLLNISELGLRFFRQDAGETVVRLRAFSIKGPYLIDRRNSRLAAENIELSRVEVPRYARFEITFDLSREYNNPFDPDQVSVEGVFVMPGGEKVVVPGFFYRGFSRSMVDDTEKLVPRGKPKWKIRFSPMVTGEHRVRIVARDHTGTEVRSAEYVFTSIPSESPGFVRVSRRNPFYLAFDNERSYYPIGHNICYPVDQHKPYPYKFPEPKNQKTYTYDRFLTRMAENGENWARIWMTPWGFGLESRSDIPEFHGLGRYSLENAWRLDRVLELAEEKKMYLNLTLDHYSEFNQSWQYNAYNKQAGGHLQYADDFFEDVKSKEIYKKRLRYIVARWGYSPHIMAWELWGEVNLTPNYASHEGLVSFWHKQMADYLRSLDPWKHMVFSHCHNWQYGFRIWNLPEIECVQGNGYIRPPNRSTSHVANFRGYISEVEYLKKPIFVAEYGGKSEQGAPSADYLEAQLHTGIWASICYPFAGAAMHWWWDFVDGRDLYFHYRALSRFCKDIDRVKQTFHTVEPEVNSPGTTLKAVGMQAKAEAFFWVYHPGVFSTLKNIPTVPGASFAIEGLAAGKYVVEFWDTYKGELVGKTSLQTAGEVIVSLPPVHRDLAVKIHPVL